VVVTGNGEDCTCDELILHGKHAAWTRAFANRRFEFFYTRPLERSAPSSRCLDPSALLDAEIRPIRHGNDLNRRGIGN
jgi:hypothetical protein